VFIKSKGTHISEHVGHKELSSNTAVHEFLNPEYVYIPLVEQNTPCEAIVKVGEKVLVGQVIAMKTGRFSSPMHAPISGEVVSISQKMWHSSGKMVATIQIKNDYLETSIENTKKANDLDKLSESEIVEIIKQAGVVGLGGSGFPAYAKYNVNNPIDYVIINAAECEPYITADYVLMHEHLADIINGAKFVKKAVGAKKVVIAIKENKKALIEKINQEISKEADFSVYLLHDVYPAGWEKYIVERVTGKTYSHLPSEVGAVVNNSATIYAINDAIVNRKPLIEKLVTITGEGIKDPKNVRVKIGTVIKDIISEIGGYVEGLGDAYFISGGPMTGKSIMFDTLVVHRSLSSVIVMPKEVEVDTLPCMGCGKCGDVCPVFLSPIVIKEALDSNNLEKMIEFKADACMQCGLCSYICPSRIELTDAVTRAKSKVLAKR
jgi:electron transport complex protein RnfC